MFLVESFKILVKCMEPIANNENSKEFTSNLTLSNLLGLILDQNKKTFLSKLDIWVFFSKNFSVCSDGLILDHEKKNINPLTDDFFEKNPR